VHSIPSRLVGISQKFKNGLRAVVVCYGTGADDPSVVWQQHRCWTYCVNHHYRIERTCVEIVSPDSPEEDATDQTPSQALKASFERMKAAVEAMNRRPNAPNPFELVEKREADVIVMYSPNLFVTKKEALADILWAMPPIVFARGWQDAKEEQQLSGDVESSGDKEQ